MTYYESCQVVVHQEEADPKEWSELNSDIVELIFSKLPEASIWRAASVCRQWYSVTQMPTFCEFYQRSKNAHSFSRFVCIINGVKYTFEERSDDRGGYMFHPVDKRHNPPTVSCPEDGDVPATEAAGGLHIAYTGAKKTIVRYKLSLVEKMWKTTPEMPYFVQDPIVGVVQGDVDGGGHKLVVAGGLAIYSEADEQLAVTIYDEKTNSWGYCEPLPKKFRSCASSFFMAAVVHDGKFYVYDRYSGLVSWLDINSNRWSPVVALWPSRRLSQLFFVSRPGTLCLVGVEGFSERDIQFTVWSTVEDESGDTMRIGEIMYSNVFPNASYNPPSILQRWRSSFIEISSGIIGVLMLLLIQFIIRFYKASKRAYDFLRGVLNSTATAVRKRACD